MHDYGTINYGNWDWTATNDLKDFIWQGAFDPVRSVIGPATLLEIICFAFLIIKVPLSRVCIKQNHMMRFEPSTEPG